MPQLALPKRIPMLALRPICEHCAKPLPPSSTEAMICSFECTFCRDCVEEILNNVCPNCGGGFTPRPIRPADELQKYPATMQRLHKPADPDNLKALQKRFASIPPEER